MQPKTRRMEPVIEPGHYIFGLLSNPLPCKSWLLETSHYRHPVIRKKNKERNKNKCQHWPDNEDALGQFSGSLPQCVSFMVAVKASMLQEKESQSGQCLNIKSKFKIVPRCSVWSYTPWLDQSLEGSICLSLSFHPVKKLVQLDKLSNETHNTNQSQNIWDEL